MSKVFWKDSNGRLSRICWQTVAMAVLGFGWNLPSMAGEDCIGPRIALTVSPSDCQKVQFGSDNVAVIGVDIATMRFEKAKIVEGPHITVYLRRSPNGVPRGETSLAGAAPISAVGGVKQYSIRGTKVSTFEGYDGRTVYVTEGVNTFEGNRMLSDDIQIFYRFSKSLTDFLSIDSNVSTLVKSAKSR